MSKRQRHVYDTGEIPHLWAHQTQADARNPQGNLYFEGDTIYSYGAHFPIARHVTNKRGRKAVLLTTRTYSSMTAGHVSQVRGAIPDSLTTYHVSCPTDSPQSQVSNFLRELQHAVDSAAKRKMENVRARDVDTAREWRAECQSFCKFYGIEAPEFPELPKVDRKKAREQDLAIKGRRDEKRERERVEWEARAAARKAEADTWNASGVCTHDPKHDAHQWGQVGSCKRQREDEDWMAHRAEKLDAWRAGEDVQLRNAWELPVMLRIRTFGADADVAGEVGRVETSKGAQVPISHAKRALKFVREVVARGEMFQANGHTFHIGHYAIDKVEADGTLHAGCHVIPYAEIERIAPELEAL